MLRGCAQDRRGPPDSSIQLIVLDLRSRACQSTKLLCVRVLSARPRQSRRIKGQDVFTGIISEIGKVVGARKAGENLGLTVRAPGSCASLQVNDSVAINGVCQTVVEKGAGTFHVQAVAETLKKTSLAELRDGAEVNLELAMKLEARFGGHIVMGHVDAVGTVLGLADRSGSWLVRIGYPLEYAKYLIPVGSIAVDGVSLTVAELGEGSFSVSIIPHTWEHTTFGRMRVGRTVNLEFDCLGKYVERLLSAGGRVGAHSNVSEETLRKWGYSS
jgi:riboflavin synthase